MTRIVRLVGFALLAHCGTACAGPIACYYNSQQQYTGADSAAEGAPLGGPTRAGAGDYYWSYVINATDGTSCPKPKMPAPANAPAPGDFVVGGGSNGNDCFALLRRPDGHLAQVMDANNSFRFSPATIAAISDARMVAAAREWGLVVHADGSVSLYGMQYPKPTHVDGDITFIAGNYLAVHQNGAVTSLLGSGPNWTPGWQNAAALSSDGNYALTRDGKILGSSSERGYPVFSKITTARAVAANIHQGVALLADGTLVAWDKAFGPSGNRDAYNMPHPPSGLAGITSIAAGGNFFLALKSDGTVVQWGGLLANQSPPPGLAGIQAIAAGPSCSMAAVLKSDGTLATWHIR